MPSTKLFAYNIEENDGKLVITIDGLYAQSAIQHLRSEVETGRGWRALSRISPIGALNRLSYQAARAQQLDAELGMERASETAPAGASAGLDLETIFKQGFAETADDFNQHLDRFAGTLVQLKAEFEANQAKAAAQGATPAPPADKKVAK